MKSTIRKCVFETNSSTTHSIVIMTAEQSDKWENKGLYYYYDRHYNQFEFKKIKQKLRPINGTLYTEEEVLNFLKLIGYVYNEDDYVSVESFVKECDAGFRTYDMWIDSDYLEYDSESYTTPGGEKIVTYCKYGYGG